MNKLIKLYAAFALMAGLYGCSSPVDKIISKKPDSNNLEMLINKESEKLIDAARDYSKDSTYYILSERKDGNFILRYGKNSFGSLKSAKIITAKKFSSGGSYIEFNVENQIWSLDFPSDKQTCPKLKQGEFNDAEKLTRYLGSFE